MRTVSSGSSWVSRPCCRRTPSAWRIFLHSRSVPPRGTLFRVHFNSSQAVCPSCLSSNLTEPNKLRSPHQEQMRRRSTGTSACDDPLPDQSFAPPTPDLTIKSWGKYPISQKKFVTLPPSTSSFALGRPTNFFFRQWGRARRHCTNFCKVQFLIRPLLRVSPAHQKH